MKLNLDFLFFLPFRLSGLENGLLGLSSRVNAILWARSSVELENIDIICFGHLLYEMCTGYELSQPRPSPGHLQLKIYDRYPQVSVIQSNFLYWIFCYNYVLIDL